MTQMERGTLALTGMEFATNKVGVGEEVIVLDAALVLERNKGCTLERITPATRRRVSLVPWRSCIFSTFEKFQFFLSTFISKVQF